MKLCYRTIVALAVVFGAAAPGPASAEWLCDSSSRNCRTSLVNLIDAETQRIDVAFWFMEDSRYVTALIAAHNRGVPVRVLIDSKANTSYPLNPTMYNQLRDAGIPMRRIASRYLHWKFMVFAGQNTVQFGSANYSPHAFVPVEPLVDFIDEVILFSDDSAIVNSFKTRFDDAWVNISQFTNYANVPATLTRAYPVSTTSSALNFPPFQDFGARSVGRYNAETVAIDAVMYRLGDRRHADALIAARQRGIPVRLLIEPGQYRDPRRPWSSYDTDRLYVAGVTIRKRVHAGWNHEKLTLLRGQRMAVFGSQNWTNTSGQYEHNYFTTKTALYNWLSDRFTRKWTSSAETAAFTPLAPDTPGNRSPSDGTVISGTQVTLRWDGGLWAHKYDIYFGTSSNPPRVATDLELGFSASTDDRKSYTVSGLAPNTTYYWRIVGKTMANVSRSSTTRVLYTGSGGAATLPSPWVSRDVGAVGAAGSASASGGTFTVRGAGADVWGTADAFHYAYQTMSGDGTITARVASIAGTDTWTKVGVMIRGGTSASAAHGFMIVSLGRGIAFQRRRTSGGLTIGNSGGGGTAPRWVRLTRAGGRVTAYVSTTGTSWTNVGSDTVALPSTALVGLAVSSHVSGQLSSATFDSVTISQ
jgi:hypothetical protein